MIQPAGGATLVPTVRFSDRQISVGPFVGLELADGTRQSFPTLSGEPDLAKVMDNIPGAREADVFVHWCMPGLTPRNVAAFPGRKVLILGDTQHGSGLSTILQYAARERFDVIFAEKRQHAHWFAEAGAGAVHWLPGIVADAKTHAFSQERRREIVVVGHLNKSHARRRLYLDELKRRGYPLRHLLCPPEELAGHYSASLISLNVSLNGDANLRFFEVPAAGGFLLTDRLSELAGVGTFYREGEHYAAFDDIYDLCAKLDRYLATPRDAFVIAQQGQNQFAANLTRSATVARFWRVVENGQDEPNFSLMHEPRLQRPRASLDAVQPHLELYESLQEINRIVESPRVLLLPGVSGRVAADTADLHRFTLFTLETDALSVMEANAMGLNRHLRAVDIDTARGMSWDAVIGREGSDAAAFAGARTISVR